MPRRTVQMQINKMYFKFISLLAILVSVNESALIPKEKQELIKHHISNIKKNAVLEWEALCKEKLSASVLTANWHNYRSQLDGFERQINSELAHLEWRQLLQRVVWLKVLSKARAVNQSLRPPSRSKQLNCLEDDKNEVRKILRENLYPVYIAQQRMDQWGDQIYSRLSTFQAHRFKNMYDQNATTLVREMQHFSKNAWQLATDFTEVWSELEAGAKQRARHLPLPFEWELKGYAIYDQMLGDETDHYRLMFQRQNQINNQASGIIAHHTLLTLILPIATIFGFL